jgi:hypothetical protein
VKSLNLIGVKNTVLIIKGKIVAYEHMTENQRNELIKEVRNDLTALVDLINNEVEKANKIKSALFEAANSL